MSNLSRTTSDNQTILLVPRVGLSGAFCAGSGAGSGASFVGPLVGVGPAFLDRVAPVDDIRGQAQDIGAVLQQRQGAPQAGEQGIGEGTSKEGIAKTKFAQVAKDHYGKASNELFTQFVARIHIEIPNATLALFSKLKYVTAPTLDKFRSEWASKYLSGFVVHSKWFDGLDGNFPIGFLVWDTSKKAKVSDVKTTVFDDSLEVVGEKTFQNPDDQQLLTNWIHRPETIDEIHVPLKNAIVPATASKDLRGVKWSEGAIGYFNCAGNEPQNTGGLTMLFSSGYGSGRGLYVTSKIVWQVAIVFAVRRLIKPTWLNDRDQFLRPREALTEEFKNDCLIWTLFNGSNLTAGADGLEWNSRQWSLVNHFIPFTETEVGASGRFESSFMVDYLRGKAFSPEAQAVLNAGREIWRAYHAAPMPRKIREELKLNRPDVGWYQIRKALEANAENMMTDFAPFRQTYDLLTTKLRPMVYSLGFLKQ